MWRSFFLAIGISLCILGAECLVLERAVLAGPKNDFETSLFLGEGAPRRVIEPPEWAAWSLLSSGAVVILYSFTVPRLVAGK